MSPSRRLVAVLCALLHLLVTGAAPLADARLEASARGARDHVESQQGGACSPVHDHAHCLFCRVIGEGGTPSRVSAPLPALPIPCGDASAPRGAFVPPTHVSSLGSRAPPAA